MIQFIYNKGGQMSIAVLVIILILVLVLSILRKNIKWGVYVLGTAEVLFRLLHTIGDNLGIEEVNSLINKVFPTSLFAIAKKYTTGLVYDILFWAIIIILAWFVVYLIKYLFKEK